MINQLLRQISSALGEISLGVPESLFKSDPKRALNTALRELGAPGINDLQSAAQLRRALRRIQSEV